MVMKERKRKHTKKKKVRVTKKGKPDERTGKDDDCFGWTSIGGFNPPLEITIKINKKGGWKYVN